MLMLTVATTTKHNARFLAKRISKVEETGGQVEVGCRGEVKV